MKEGPASPSDDKMGALPPREAYSFRMTQTSSPPLLLTMAGERNIILKDYIRLIRTVFVYLPAAGNPGLRILIAVLDRGG